MKIFKPGLRSVISILVTAFLVLVFAWLGPRALSLYYQVKGGRLLEQALQTSGDVSSEAIPCTLEPVTDPAARTLLEKAVELLDRSARFDPGLSQAYLLQGRAECLLGEYDKAVEALRQYTDLRPKNPLGHLEAGFALASECNYTIQGSPAKGLCSVANLRSSMLDEWREAGIEPENFIAAGSQKFAAHQYQEAVSWFQSAASLGDNLSPSTLFKWGASAILAGYPMPNEIGSDIIDIYPITSTTIIEAENLLWMKEDQNWNLNYGDKLILHPSTDPNVGVMWWSGPAVAFIKTPGQADYQITIRVQDSETGSLRFRLERDTIPNDEFELPGRDFNWYELQAFVTIPEGIHLIGINYLEDTGDLSIDWIHFQRVDNR